MSPTLPSITNSTEQTALEKLTVIQTVQNLPAFYATRRLITVFIRTRHWSLSWVRWFQPTPSQSISLRFILILSPHLHLGLPSGVFPSSFPTKILYAFPHHWYDHSNNIWCSWSVQVTKLLIMQSSPAPRYVLPLRSTYSPQQPVLKHCLCTSFLCNMQVSFFYGEELLAPPPPDNLQGGG
jgi:hypothetical protein